MKQSKNPKSWTVCEKCDRFYGFVACRISLNDGRNICLTCAAQEEKDIPTQSEGQIKLMV